MRFIRRLLTYIFSAAIVALPISCDAASLISSASIIPSGSSGGTSGIFSTIGAKLYIVALVDCTACTTTTVTDNQGNTYTRFGDGQDCGPLFSKVYLYKSINPITSASFTFTIGGGVNNQSAGFEAFDTVITPVDQLQYTSNTCNSCTSVQPGAQTPAAGNYVVVSGLCTLTTPSTITVNSPFTATTAATGSSGLYYGVGLAYWIPPSSLSANPTWNSTASTDLGANLAVFSANPPRRLGGFFHSFPP